MREGYGFFFHPEDYSRREKPPTGKTALSSTLVRILDRVCNVFDPYEAPYGREPKPARRTGSSSVAQPARSAQFSPPDQFGQPALPDPTTTRFHIVGITRDKEGNDVIEELTAPEEQKVAQAGTMLARAASLFVERTKWVVWNRGILEGLPTPQYICQRCGVTDPADMRLAQDMAAASIRDAFRDRQEPDQLETIFSGQRLLTNLEREAMATYFATRTMPGPGLMIEQPFGDPRPNKPQKRWRAAADAKRLLGE